MPWAYIAGAVLGAYKPRPSSVQEVGPGKIWYSEPKVEESGWECSSCKGDNPATAGRCTWCRKHKMVLAAPTQKQMNEAKSQEHRLVTEMYLKQLELNRQWIPLHRKRVQKGATNVSLIKEFVFLILGLASRILS